mgnify:CR=1 FL=1
MEEKNKNFIKIYSDSIVYVAAPANLATGGPELLHQLAYHLRNNLKIDAYMYYFNANDTYPVHPEYKCYHNPFVKEIKDDEKNILILPEVFTECKIFNNCLKIRKCLWWLSIDNFYINILLNVKTNFFLSRTVNKLFKVLFRRSLIDINKKVMFKAKKFDLLHYIDSNWLHLVQSVYAFNHLLTKNIPKDKIFYLSDYLNEDFLKTQTDLAQKQNIIVYNPQKGFAFTDRILKKAKDIKFIPIINMTREEVIKTLQRAKVYIDFGNHPGKDRIPREAAILGCCVITGKRGSAAFYDDVPIPEEYKFEDKKENIPAIIAKIKDCLENYDERYNDFNNYRDVIKQEPKKFLDDLNKIFVRI